MIKVAIIGYGDRGKSTLNEYLKILYTEGEIAYFDDVEQLVNEFKKDNEQIIDESNTRIIMPESFEHLDEKLNSFLSQRLESIEYIKEDEFLAKYMESPKEKYSKDELKKDNYKSKQKIKSYKR